MIVKKIVVAIVILCLLVGGTLSSCKPSPKSTEPTAETSTALSAIWCKGVIGAFKNLDKGEFPKYLAEYDSSKQGGEFNANQYFYVLTHLSLEPGYVLDWVYDYQYSGGAPVLYVRPESMAPFNTYTEFAAATDNFTRPENDMSLVWFVAGDTSGMSGNRIKIDGTNEGYFEYAVLQILGAQFYLWWHANYNDARIICDATDIDDVIKFVGNSGYNPLTGSMIKDARKINPQPIIEADGDTVTVKLVVFSMWGGFSRYEYTMYRDYPNMVIGFNNVPLVEYDCGIRF